MWRDERGIGDHRRGGSLWFGCCIGSEAVGSPHGVVTVVVVGFGGGREGRCRPLSKSFFSRMVLS